MSLKQEVLKTLQRYPGVEFTTFSFSAPDPSVRRTIGTLRREGYNIVTEMKHDGIGRIGHYRLETEAPL